MSGFRQKPICALDLICVAAHGATARRPITAAWRPNAAAPHAAAASHAAASQADAADPDADADRHRRRRRSGILDHAR